MLRTSTEDIYHSTSTYFFQGTIIAFEVFFKVDFQDIEFHIVLWINPDEISHYEKKDDIYGKKYQEEPHFGPKLIESRPGKNIRK